MSKLNERADKLQETVGTEGWVQIEEWFDAREKDITEGIKRSITLKADEMGKWGVYYSGELSIINHFRAFLKTAIAEDKPNKVKSALKKFKDILG
jgi:hypothetical protein